MRSSSECHVPAILLRQHHLHRPPGIGPGVLIRRINLKRQADLLAAPQDIPLEHVKVLVESQFTEHLVDHHDRPAVFGQNLFQGGARGILFQDLDDQELVLRGGGHTLGNLVRDILARPKAVHRLPTEAIEDSSGIMFLVADGIDDPSVTRVQCAGLAVHIRNEVVRDVPESVPLAGPATADEQDEDLPDLVPRIRDEVRALMNEDKFPRNTPLWDQSGPI